jgi:Fuc2NAc and GlcNAc transferase
VIATIGFIDDRYGLSAPVRLLAQLLSAAILLLAFGGPPDVPVGAGSISLGAVGWVIGVPAVVWSINLFNFMDGVDGLAASQAIFVFGGAIAVAHGSGMQGQILPLLVLVAASAGFLVWNYAPAKIFMGDVGSGFLGYAVAVGVLASSGTGAVNVWTWLVLDAAFIADATTTLVVRLVRGQQLFHAHRSHAYQRLARRLGSHGAVTALYAAINLTWCLPWAIATTRWPGAGWALTATALAPLLLAAAGLGAGIEE